MLLSPSLLCERTCLSRQNLSRKMENQWKLGQQETNTIKRDHGVRLSFDYLDRKLLSTVRAIMFDVRLSVFSEFVLNSSRNCRKLFLALIAVDLFRFVGHVNNSILSVALFLHRFHYVQGEAGCLFENDIADEWCMKVYGNRMKVCWLLAARNWHKKSSVAGRSRKTAETFVTQRTTNAI